MSDNKTPSETADRYTLAERSVVELNERLAMVFRMSPLGIIISARPDGRVVDVNPAIVELLGYSREQLLGKTRAELDVGVDADVADGFARALASTGMVRNVETRLRRADGEQRAP